MSRSFRIRCTHVSYFLRPRRLVTSQSPTLQSCDRWLGFRYCPSLHHSSYNGLTCFRLLHRSPVCRSCNPLPSHVRSDQLPVSRSFRIRCTHVSYFLRPRRLVTSQSPTLQSCDRWLGFRYCPSLHHSSYNGLTCFRLLHRSPACRSCNPLPSRVRSDRLPASRSFRMHCTLASYFLHPRRLVTSQSPTLQSCDRWLGFRYCPSLHHSSYNGLTCFRLLHRSPACRSCNPLPSRVRSDQLPAFLSFRIRCTLVSCFLRPRRLGTSQSPTLQSCDRWPGFLSAAQSKYHIPHILLPP